MSNVFKDLGFESAEAMLLRMKSDLHIKVMDYAKNFSQAELRSLLDESQPRISDLLNGKISKFSIETLLMYAAKLRMRPVIRIFAPRRTVMMHAIRRKTQ
jgi:predicted XRE-type DNA-binding protein